MRRIITLLFLFPVIIINAQVVDINHFEERLMSEIIFSEMNNYSELNGSYSLCKTSKGQKRIYRYIKRNDDRLNLDDLNEKINCRILRKYESRVIAKTAIVGNVGLIDSIKINGIITYKDIADSCITHWTNSENLIFMNWSHIGEAVTYFNKKEQGVYVFFGFFQ